MASNKLQNGLTDEPLFSRDVLHTVDWSQRHATFRGDVSPETPGEGLLMRPLQTGDFARGYTKLLSQLTNVGEVDEEAFINTFSTMKNAPREYYIAVIEDVSTNEVIGSATLVIEHKFIHHCGKRGRVEDVVVNKEYRGRQLGKLLVETMTLLGKQLGCYKMSLEAKDEKVPFYESFGYSKDDGNHFMLQRYSERN